jgi:CheY-like chemotaxis protein
METNDTTRLRVLIVDDNPADQEWMAIHLRRAWTVQGVMELEFASTTRQAVSKTWQKDFGLIVLDWNLTPDTGVQVLRDLRQRGSQTPVVVVSGSEREELGDDLDDLQAAFLHKDVLSTPALCRAIGHAMTLVAAQPTAPLHAVVASAHTVPS